MHRIIILGMDWILLLPLLCYFVLLDFCSGWRWIIIRGKRGMLMGSWQGSVRSRFKIWIGSILPSGGSLEFNFVETGRGLEAKNGWCCDMLALEFDGGMVMLSEIMSIFTVFLKCFKVFPKWRRVANDRLRFFCFLPLHFRGQHMPHLFCQCLISTFLSPPTFHHLSRTHSFRSLSYSFNQIHSSERSHPFVARRLSTTALFKKITS